MPWKVWKKEVILSWKSLENHSQISVRTLELRAILLNKPATWNNFYVALLTLHTLSNSVQNSACTELQYSDFPSVAALYYIMLHFLLLCICGRSLKYCICGVRGGTIQTRHCLGQRRFCVRMAPRAASWSVTLAHLGSLPFHYSRGLSAGKYLNVLTWSIS